MKDTEAVSLSLSLFEKEHEVNSQSFEEQRRKLISVIAHFIDKDYHKLTAILYRIDVDENKLKKALLEKTTPIAETIADLIIERQQQKIITRNQYKNRL